MTVVVAEDDPRRRNGVRLGLEDYGFAVVAEAEDAASAVAVATEHRPSVCLLEVDMPGDGIAAAVQIASLVPETKIAMLAATATQADVFRAITAGADGYLLRTTPPDRLSAALRGVLDGESALPRAMTASLVEYFRSSREVARPRPRRLRLGSRLMFVPRFVRHLFRRLRQGLLLGEAWSSTRERMADYR